MSKAVKSVGSVAKGTASAFTGGLIGGGGGTGVLGTGRFKAQQIPIDKKSFREKIADDARVKESRAEQVALTEAIRRRATGEESVAAQQLQAAQDRALAQQAAIAAGTRGRGGALAQREQARNAAQQQQQLRQESSIAAAQERQAAQQLLGQQVAQQRASDIATAESDRKSRQELETLRVNQSLGVGSLNQAGFASAAAARGNLASGAGGALAAFSDGNLKSKVNVMTGGGSTKKVSDKVAKEKASKLEKDDDKKSDKGDKAKKAGKGFSQGMSKSQVEVGPKQVLSLDTVSDEDKKENVKANTKTSKSFLDKLNSVTYEYKDPEAHGEGKQFGVIAQDLEEAGDVGKQMVVDTPEGKMVDFGKGFGAILASQIELNERLKQLESKKSKKKKS